MSIKCPSRVTGVIQGCNTSSTRPPTCEVKPSHSRGTPLPLPPPLPSRPQTPLAHTPPTPPPSAESSGRQEIIHMVSHRGVGVQCQPERSAACLLSPAIEVIHRTIIPRRIVQQKIAKAAAPWSPPPPLPPPLLPLHFVTLQSYHRSADASLLTLMSAEA